MSAVLEPLAPREPPGKTISIVLAVTMHLALATFLIYGIRWQTNAPAAVEVSLVRARPEPVTESRPPVPPRVEPRPEPPPPKAEPKPPPRPDIVLKEKPEKKPPPREAPPQPAPDPFQQLLNKELTSLDQRKAAQAIEREQAQLKANSAAAAAGRASKQWADRIIGAIKPRIVRVPGVSGNPEAKYEVALLPDGTVFGEPKKIKSTGSPALDANIERAILQSSPLPMPADPSAFQRNLTLTFRPLED